MIIFNIFKINYTSLYMNVYDYLKNKKNVIEFRVCLWEFGLWYKITFWFDLLLRLELVWVQILAKA